MMVNIAIIMKNIFHYDSRRALALFVFKYSVKMKIIIKMKQ
jgi:hypothetical protein